MSKARPADWFDRAFDALYAELYSHRDDSEATQLVGSLAERFPLRGTVLDIGCGAGRLLDPLRAAFGSSVGLDRSWVLLRRARSRAVLVPLVRGDMRELPFADGVLGSAVSLFTSFGYFDNVAEDERALREAGRVLAPGGRFVLDYLNPEVTRQVGPVMVEERRWVDPSGPFLRKEVSVAGDESVRYEERVRLYAPSHLESLCEAVGLGVRALWGGYDGAAYDPEGSSRIIVLAERTGDRS
jgi:SAM-dependent methyltransferase